MQVKPVYMYVHSQHHQIGSAITALGTAFGDALDIGLCFVAFHLVLGVYLYFQPAWNIAAVVLLIIFEVPPHGWGALTGFPGCASCACSPDKCVLYAATWAISFPGSTDRLEVRARPDLRLHQA